MDLSIINPLGCLSLTMSEHKLLLSRLIEQKQQFSETFNTQACFLTPGKYCQFLISVTLINIQTPMTGGLDTTYKGINMYNSLINHTDPS